jgi:hypothetical protein
MDNEREYLPWMSDYLHTTLIAASRMFGACANEYNSDSDCTLQLPLWCIGEYGVGEGLVLWYIACRRRIHSHIASHHFFMCLHYSVVHVMLYLNTAPLILLSSHRVDYNIQDHMTRATAK